MQLDTLQFAHTLYEESKFWFALGGGLWSAFKGFNWIKAIRTNDLHHIQMGVNDLKLGLDSQTTAVVGELKELRSDFRTFYSQQFPILELAKLQRSPRKSPKRR